MKIWIVTIDDDDGTRSNPYTNKDDAHTIAYTWCAARWPAWFPNDNMPEAWQTAYEKMVDCVGFMDSIIIAEFDVEKPEPNELDASYILKAKAAHMSDECEIDDGAPVSIGEDGAFVQAWLWVPDDEISDLDLLKKHGYRISSAATFVNLAPVNIIQEVVAGAGKLDHMVLWSDDPEGFHLTMPTQDELLEEFKGHVGAL